jgi:hypothetical protein
MKLFKLLTSGLLVGLIFVFVKQNLGALTTKITFGLDLFIREPVSWSHEVYGLLLMAGFGGFVLGFLSLLRPYLNIRRTMVQEHPQKEKQESSSPPRPEDIAQPPPTSPSQD